MATKAKSTARKPRQKKEATSVPKTEEVLVSVLLDRSGSMGTIRDATIAGYNKFLAEQQAEEGEARMSLVQFDDRYEPNFVGTPLTEVAPMTYATYTPRGSTALHDAIVHSINDTKKWVKKNKYNGRVLFLIITDGDENSSRESDLKDVTKLIQECEDDLEWTFAFMGANLDAYAVGGGMGISAGATRQFRSTPQSVADNYTAVSDSLTNYRTSGSSFSGKTASVNFFQNDPNDPNIAPANATAAPAAPAAAANVMQGPEVEPLKTSYRNSTEDSDTGDDTP